MLFYLVASTPKEQIEPTVELKFFEWLKYLKKSGRVTEYWAFKDKPGLAAVLRLNFPADLDELLNNWNERQPSEFSVNQLKDIKALEADLAKRLL